MKNFTKWALGFMLLMGPVLVVKADMDKDKQAMPAPKLPAEFAQLKSLVGTWKGKADMHGKNIEVKNTFELTSAGTVILEKIMAGTEHEMVSVYCSEGGKMAMTHYCSVGNQPKMVLKKASDKELVFEMKGNTGIGSKKDMHMHAMTITWKDKDHITESWSLYNGGKMQGCNPFELTRVK